jgi:hypothetical protein
MRTTVNVPAAHYRERLPRQSRRHDRCAEKQNDPAKTKGYANSPM